MQTILFLQLVFMVGKQWLGFVCASGLLFYVLASIAITSHFHAHPDPDYDPIFILNKKKMKN
jgi:hypothetical protein